MCSVNEVEHPLGLLALPLQVPGVERSGEQCVRGGDCRLGTRRVQREQCARREASPMGAVLGGVLCQLTCLEENPL
jgi:hypothetical protein